MFLRPLLILTVLLGAVAASVAEPPASVATVDPLDGLETLGYQPLTLVSGTVRFAGSTTLQQAAALWAEGFTAAHPDVVVAIDSAGSDAGWQALLTGMADAALLSRPVTEIDRKAFAECAGVANRKLVVVPVGFERLVWIVHAANPIAELRWSPDTGVMDPAAVPPRVHATELGSGTRWHLDRLLTGTTAVPIDLHEHATIKDLCAAVAADRDGFGLIGDNDGAWPGVRTLPLAIPAGATPLADAVPGSERTPDCRPLFVALAVPQDGDWPALLREFVAYVLSWQGQLDVASDGLLPLTRSEVLAQREILGGPVER